MCSITENIGTQTGLGMKRAYSGCANNIRVGKAEEIATIAVFLASEDSSFVNGETIVADAGWTAY